MTDIFNKETQAKVTETRAYIDSLSREVTEDMNDEEKVIAFIIQYYDRLDAFEQNLLICRYFLGFKTWVSVAEQMLTSKQNLSKIMAPIKRNMKSFVLSKCEEHNINARALKLKI